LLFQFFRETDSVYGVAHRFDEKGLKFPKPAAAEPRRPDEWTRFSMLNRHARTLSILPTNRRLPRTTLATPTNSSKIRNRVMTHPKITPQHLQQTAYVYVRQSTLGQVLHHQESTQRQYALKDKALSLGWNEGQIRVLDRDLGLSGTQSQNREDFKTLLADVSLGEVGAVLALEASRLARSNADWHRLIEVCSLTGTLILDEDGVYDPADFNDGLLLGLKGTMSAAELHFLCGRLQGGKRNKAERGELRFPLPVGLSWNEKQMVLDPDQEVQGAVRLLFQFFRDTGSAYGVAHRFAEKGLKFPKRAYGGVWNGQLIWGHLTDRRVLSVLHNPAYAGVYVFGRFRCVKQILQDGQIRQRVRERPRDTWLVEIQNHHPGYLSWEDYLENLDRLEGNCTHGPETALPGAAREGLALLHGLLMCGQCGRRLTVRYRGNGGIYPTYECNWRRRQAQAKRACMTIPCPPLDEAVTDRVLKAVDAEQLTLALAAHDELAQRDESLLRQWHMRLERAQYEADLAQRRYEQVDPANRLVAAWLESRWNEALRRVGEVRHQMTEFQRRQTRTFSAEQRDAILALAGNLPQLWCADTTLAKDKKRILRLLVEDITVERGEGREVQLHVRWSGGACEDLRVTLPAKIQDRLRYPSERIEEIRRLAAEHTDAEIVDAFNRRGQLSSRGQPFTAKMIAWIRSKHRIPAVKLRRPDELTVDEIASKFGVSRGVVYYWINRKILPARQLAANRPYWITLSEQQEKELRTSVRSSKRIHTEAHSDSSTRSIPNVH
jgi:DNA invertase Pin-like site-specific DNA recombinase